MRITPGRLWWKQLSHTFLQSFSQATDQETARLKNYGDGFLNETIFIHQMNAGCCFFHHMKMSSCYKSFCQARIQAQGMQAVRNGVWLGFLHLHSTVHIYWHRGNIFRRIYNKRMVGRINIAWSIKQEPYTPTMKREYFYYILSVPNIRLSPMQACFSGK